MKGSFLLIGLLSLNGFVQGELTSANPVRKVVTMLQAMQKRIVVEGEKEQAMYDKFMCYCKNGAGSLEQSIAAATTKSPQVSSDIEAAEAQKIQLKDALASHQSDRDAAKSAIAEATSIREKEATAFGKEKTEFDSNIDAVTKATFAIEKGSTGFLQTNAAQVLRHLLVAKQDMLETDRQALQSFLSASQSGEYAPQSGEIQGILKQLNDEMSKARADAVAAEQAAISSFDTLVAAKKKEVAALTAAIEEKTMRVGEVGVNLVQMQNDLSDTQAALAEDQAFLANMEKDCTTKTAEWDEIVKTRSQEQVALAETIKILNDDDALELFKKTLPTPASSFVQLKESTASTRARAFSQIQATRSPKLDFILLALHGKKIGFEKVVNMIDDMVVLLQQEQLDDEHKKEYCAKQFDFSDDKKKGLQRAVADAEVAIANAEEGVATTTTEIKALEAGIEALDKSVAEATEQREAEKADFKELTAQDNAAKQLLGLAKNRLNQFYNPKLYKSASKRVLSEEERITVNMGGELEATAPPGGIAGTGVAVLAQVSEHVQGRDEPAAPPAAPGAYTKKSEESTGVIAMIDLLIKDLDKEVQEAAAMEKDSQADYETMMKDSSAKRSQDSKSLTKKKSAKADMESDLLGHRESKSASGKELMATEEYMSSLHSECDWMLKYFETRKEARSREMESLKNAKAILSGADFALLQTNARSLRGLN